MIKGRKISEKGTRFPDTRIKHLSKIIPEYLNSIESLNAESARSHKFAILLNNLFEIEPDFIENYLKGIEKHIKTKEKDRILRGRADNLFGNVIIEFERDINNSKIEAEEQLKKYTAFSWSNELPEKRTPYICIATDGVTFLVYTPVLDNPEEKFVHQNAVSLNLIDKSNWRWLKPYEIFYWLDRYFLRKEILRPTTENITNDFGLNSHTFKISSKYMLNMWEKVKGQSSFSVIYETWEKYLIIVYGSKVTGDELFIRHTYLATLSKLMSWVKISEETDRLDGKEIISILTGISFRNYGIENFVEEDFSSWLIRTAELEKASIEIVRWFFSVLKNYNLRELSEDVLKSLYQELVDPETRHDLGEFYTPDWLAHKIVNKFLDENKKGRMLDPSCGSGTFLYISIKEKIERLGDSYSTLSHILDSVVGIDIHPLAVIIAKTNYVMALGDLLKKRKGNVTVPVFLSDSVRLPERIFSGEMYQVRIDNSQIFIHKDLFKDMTLFDRSIDLIKNFAVQNKNKKTTLDNFKKYLEIQKFEYCHNENIVKTLYDNQSVLKCLIEKDKDSIWAYVLKNIYKPLLFKNSFDFIIGNPPWISYRFLESEYQKFVKNQIVEKYNLLKGRPELMTHLEIGVLFLIRCSDLYLRTGGKTGFVLPKSIFVSDHHDDLRKRKFRLTEEPNKTIYFQYILDCERVNPLFKVPACVLFVEKNLKKSQDYPINGEEIKGNLDRKNSSLYESEQKLNLVKGDFNLYERKRGSFWSKDLTDIKFGESYYKSKFLTGATIIPRSCWFVEIGTFPLGINPECPFVKTSEHSKKKAKSPYKDIELSGTIENKLLYHTLTSTNLLPFGITNFNLVVLPILEEGNKYILLDINKSHAEGYYNLLKWLKQAESVWIEKRKSKAKSMTIFERIDRYKGLTNQNPKAKYKVVYNTSGTNIASAVIENKKMHVPVQEQEVKVNGFLADCKTNYYETDNKMESFYLISILNSKIVNMMVKPLQSRGLWGPRDICKKVFDFPIPKFDKNNKDHIKLAELGEICTKKVKNWQDSGGQGKTKNIGKLRGMVRKLLRDELEEIDKIVKKLLT